MKWIAGEKSIDPACRARFLDTPTRRVSESLANTSGWCCGITHCHTEHCSSSRALACFPFAEINFHRLARLNEHLPAACDGSAVTDDFGLHTVGIDFAGLELGRLERVCAGRERVRHVIDIQLGVF